MKPAFSLLVCLASVIPLSAAEVPKKGLHSPYTIGPAIRDVKHGTLVIPVYHYWRKGTGNTLVSYRMEVAIEGKNLEVMGPGDTMMTESHTGTKAVVQEFTIRGWQLKERGDWKAEPGLKTAAELKIHFVGSADGAEQTLDETIKVVDFEGEGEEPGQRQK